MSNRLFDPERTGGYNVPVGNLSTRSTCMSPEWPDWLRWAEQSGDELLLARVRVMVDAAGLVQERVRELMRR